MKKKNSWKSTALLVIAIVGILTWQFIPTPPPQFQENPGFRVDLAGAALADAITWGRTSYPISSIREEFNRICEKIDRQEILFAIDPRPDVHKMSFAFTTKDEGKPVIVFVGENLNNQFRMTDTELFRDYIIETILHEAHHAEHHDQSPEYVAEKHRNNEDETWWYMLEKVLVPMKQNGRLRNLHDRDVVTYALMTYKHIGGNRTHPAWKTFTYWVSRAQRSEDQLREALGLKRLFPPPQAPPKPVQPFGPQLEPNK